jgi:hypothetical protein
MATLRQAQGRLSRSALQQGSGRRDPILAPREMPQGVATVNRSVIDCGLSPSTKTHGQEGTDRGYQLLRVPRRGSNVGSRG